MKTYIALLRGINVSGQKKIKMADLRMLLEKLGLCDVSTYIQSGNIFFKSTLKSTLELEEKIKKGIQDFYGFDVAVLVTSRTKIIEILEQSPFKKEEDLKANQVYYALLKCKPNPENRKNLSQNDYPNEVFEISDDCVYLNCIKGAGKAKLTNNIIERKLKVSATTRNHRTMLKLIELSVED